jgi:modification methylase
MPDGKAAMIRIAIINFITSRRRLVPRPRSRHMSGPKKPTGNAIDKFANRLLVGHAARVMANFPDNSVDLIITSPPYWTAVEYDGGRSPWPSYGAYLDDIQAVWKECARVLRPNGKLCINAPIMPIPKAIIKQDTRHLKDIAGDIKQRILSDTTLRLYSVFIWQKQTSKVMFGSYPYPGNLIENNTIEFIHVFVKPGKPPKFDADVKRGNRLPRTEWLDLTQQIWFMYPADVKRGGDHPARFPEKLPARLIRIYTHGAVGKFPGEIVLDPFVGSGTTSAVAKRMGRRFIGIDVNERYVNIAEERIRDAVPGDLPMLFVGRPKYPTKEELEHIAEVAAGSAGRKAEAKHKRKTYGRKLGGKEDEQLTLL